MYRQYNWQCEWWPNFVYDLKPSTQEKLYLYAMETSHLVGSLKSISGDGEDALLEVMVIEAQKTSAIEGEVIKAVEIRSSLRDQIGLPGENIITRDERAKGIAGLMIDSRKHFMEPLTDVMLHRWHALVMQGGSLTPHDIGCYRTSKETMQIVSGPIGRRTVHFEAPPAERVPTEMQAFVEWFNATSPGSDRPHVPGPVHAAIAHLYFESIHPYSDGNGRIGRAIVEKSLSQDLGFPVIYSLSNALMDHRNQYYEQLNINSRVARDISPWVEFFVDQICLAQQSTKQDVTFTLQKAQFWRQHEAHLSARQIKVLRRVLANISFEGGLNAAKYGHMGKCSKATATRDLAELLNMGCLVKRAGGGHSTSYDVNVKEQT